MASSLSKAPPPHVHLFRNPSSFHSYPAILSFGFYWNTSLLHPRLSALKATVSDGDNLLRKPLLPHRNGILDGYDYEEEDEDEEDNTEEERWIDWEDQILEDTVPLVGFVRMILHSGQYESGDRLSPEHEKAILEKLLPFHPEYENKIGCGIDYITIGYHPNFERSRCLFIVRKDGEMVDFSFWKCIKGLIRKNYPLYADSFILRHFRKRSRDL
ncbi:protein DCL homolog, chloroplastic [Gastrolobium bilobum]|uniref:protein DCL homolog, chloroplastic n=1 Tax=Gastrolobium bilobum TaxID=150636 RepID=UPI002AAF6686|nr:protein DCL homolog, chloroplastic [Gastrolobium bilobum]